MPGTYSAQPATNVPSTVLGVKSTAHASSANLTCVTGCGPVIVQLIVSPDASVKDGGGAGPRSISGPVQTNAEAGPANARKTAATPRSRVTSIETIVARKS